jgi:N-acetylglucosaminyl-diphospho-decaprenol L-rhamnosyltransferase
MTQVAALDTVIVAYRSEAVIGEAVARAAQLGGRVVVVDHGDGRAARVASAAGATVVEDPSNPGFGAGQNRGVALTSSPCILLCNPDAEIDPGAVRAGAALLEARPRVAAVQGVVVNRSTGAPERSAGVEVGPVHLVGRAVGARRLLRNRRVAALAGRSRTLRDHAERVPDGPTEVDALAATAVLVRRAAFDSVGGFDPSYFLYGEDLDLCRRLRRAGWALVTVPDVWATHTGGGSAGSGWQRETSWWQGTMQFAARWWSPAAWAEAVAAASLRWARLAVRHPSHAGAALRAMVLEPRRARRAQRPATDAPAKDSTASITTSTCSTVR